MRSEGAWSESTEKVETIADIVLVTGTMTGAQKPVQELCVYGRNSMSPPSQVTDNPSLSLVNECQSSSVIGPEGTVVATVIGSERGSNWSKLPGLCPWPGSDDTPARPGAASVTRREEAELTIASTRHQTSWELPRTVRCQNLAKTT